MQDEHTKIKYYYYYRCFGHNILFIMPVAWEKNKIKHPSSLYFFSEQNSWNVYDLHLKWLPCETTVHNIVDNICCNISLLHTLEDQGDFDPDEPAIVHHMICTSPTAVRYVENSIGFYVSHIQDNNVLILCGHL